MKQVFFVLILILLVALVGFSAFITHDGEVVTPSGQGSIELDSGTYEAFPLPEYAASFISDAYKSYLVEVEPGIKVHVLEVGAGFPIFLQHGNPTSGFLYRKVASELPLDRVRVIMPTLVGLGFSSKVPASMHTLDNHVNWINDLLKELQLTELIYAGQDWGGPVGMGALRMSPELLKGAVILNTGFNAPSISVDLSPAHATVKTPLVGELLIEVLVSLFDQLPRTQGDPSSMPEEVTDLYGRPVIESGNNKAPLAMMRMVTDGPEHPSVPQMRAIEKYVAGLDIPVEIIWGMGDPILAKTLPLMQKNFPDAPVLETKAGHFLQEEVPSEIAAALVRVLGKVNHNSME